MKKKVYVDDIDNKKVKANLAFLEQGIYIGFDDELDELLKFKTKSIEKIDLLGGVPPAFNNNEFIACYPDVIVWWNGLSMEDRDEMMDSFDDKDLEKRKDELLRKIIDAYKNTGAKLECSYD